MTRDEKTKGNAVSAKKHPVVSCLISLRLSSSKHCVPGTVEEVQQRYGLTSVISPVQISHEVKPSNHISTFKIPSFPYIDSKNSLTSFRISVDQGKCNYFHGKFAVEKFLHHTRKKTQLSYERSFNHAFTGLDRKSFPKLASDT